ncbi:MAG: hypothetical protein WC059_01330 [Candidatus Paceibacterota bacterium]
MNKEILEQPSKIEFESFITEMRDLKEHPVSEGAVHFENISVDELTIDDMEMYTKLKNATLTPSEFEVYRASIERTHNKSRIFFAGYIANKLSSDVLHQQFLARKDINR